MSLAEFSLPSEDGIADKGIQCNEQESSSSSQEQQIDQIPTCSSTKAKPHHGHCFKCRKKYITRNLSSSSQSDHRHAAIVKHDLAPRSRVSKGHWNKIIYPFEWVKPGGVEGETTLEDINREIRMISAASKPIPHPVKGSVTHTCISARGFGMSGKALAYVARARTRGRGSITLIRTKD